MSEVIEVALVELGKRVGPGDMDFSVKFVVGDEGCVRLDETGVSQSDADADLVMTAEPEVFKGIMEGTINGASALMSGQIEVDGDMALAMRLGGILS